MVSWQDYVPDNPNPGSGSLSPGYDPERGRVVVSPETASAINQYMGANNVPNTADRINALRRGYSAYNASAAATPSAPSMPSLSSSGGSSGGWGGGWGGGGGGGGGGPTGVTQAQFDWATGLLGQGQPDPLTATTLDLPAYRSKFHPEMYNQLMRRFNRGVRMDTRTANRAYNQLGRFTRNNFTNAYRNPRARAAMMNQAPGMNQAQMARMFQNQGVAPEVAGEQLEGASAADRAFQNLWGVLGANEQQAQRNRLNAIAQDRQTTANALRIAALQGRTGIGLQKAGAKDEWRTRVEEQRNALRQQEALANWQRANQVGDVNFQTSSEYRNNVIQALLGMLPNLAEGVKLPGDLGPIFGLPPEPSKGGGGNKPKGESFGEGPAKGGKRSYAGGSKWFNERTGKYKPGTPPRILRRARNKGK